MKKIAVLIPYFGEWPEWINIFLESCRHNPTINWIIFTDCGTPENTTSNVEFVDMSLREFNKLANSRLGVNLKITNTYKICDLKPMYGKLFEEHIVGYDYWGFGDLDLLYGDMRKFLTDEVLSHDVISFHRDRVSAHFCLMRNTPEVRDMYSRYEGWAGVIETDRCQRFDEFYFFSVIDRKSNYFAESFSTPFTNDRPWTDGTWDYPHEWYWSDGRITNNKDYGYEFLYFHFNMWRSEWGRRSGGGQWAGLEKLVHSDYTAAKHGWRMDDSGFHALEAPLPEKQLKPLLDTGFTATHRIFRKIRFLLMMPPWYAVYRVLRYA
ncbi:MAG: DUF6625 family protein [Candidatus Altiarchaeota archaeon]